MNKKLTPSEYFNIIKSKKEVMTGTKLEEIYQNALSLANKYMITGQVEHMKKLIFCMETIDKQKELVELGITTYVSKSDVEDFIDNVSDDTVKIIELERYPREIPDEICEIIPKVKNIFDKMYIVYTDYTGKQERKIAQESKDKDPILFGVFEDARTGTIVDEWYYLGDWVDEYCDLTLEKMISTMESKNKPNIAKEIYTPKDLDELKAMVNSIEKDSNGNTWVNHNNLINTLYATSPKKDDVKPKKFLSRIKELLK